MSHYMNRAELKDQAKERISGKYTSAIGISIVNNSISLCGSYFITMISVMLSFFSRDIMGPQLVIVYILNQALSALCGVFMTGISLFYLNIACNRPARLRNMFYGFQYCFQKSFQLSLAMVLISQLISIPYEILNAVQSGYLSQDLLMPCALLSLLCLIFYVPLSLGISQIFYLMLDFPGLSARDTILKSFQIMKGQKVRLFLLQLSFFPLMFLGLLSLGVGFLWLTPYMNSTYSLFFLDLMQNKQTS